MTNIDKQKQELLNKIEELKQQVQQLDKPQFEVGKVYKKGKSIFMVTESNNTYIINYGFDYYGEWMNKRDRSIVNVYFSEYLPATTNEWKEALINHAKKMGYKEGVTIDKTELKGMIHCKVSIISSDVFEYLEDKDILLLGKYAIYSNGTWAKIIQPQPIFLGDKEVRFDEEKFAWIDDTHYSKTQIKLLLPLNPTLFNAILERMK